MNPSEFNYFKGTKLKIERARAHCDELKIEVRRFLKSNPYQLNLNKNSVHKHVSVTQINEMPEIIPLILGDFIHNCRSALDHLVTDLALVNNGKTEHLHFPTAKNSESFQERLKGKIKNVGEEALQKLSDLEIYPSGKGEVIYALHELDIADKHKMLIPNVSSVTLSNVKIGGMTIREMKSNIEKNGTNLILSNSGTSLEFDEAINFDIEISELDLFRSKSLLIVVEEIFLETERLIESFVVMENLPKRRITL